MSPPDQEVLATVRAACFAMRLPDQNISISCVLNDGSKQPLRFKRPPLDLRASDPDVPDVYLVINPKWWKKQTIDDRIESVVRIIKEELHIQKDHKGRTVKDELMMRPIIQLGKEQAAVAGKSKKGDWRQAYFKDWER